jgi:thiosulfate/3-mercaptopyruvate sulfurtransferase
MNPQPQVFTTLIAADELKALIAAGCAPVILDASFDLADTGAGARAFAEAHIPGARYVNLDTDLSGAKTGRNGRHPLPNRTEFAARVGRWGIGPGTQVVAYDAQGGVYAARAWWLLRWLGHRAVAVLDGGLAAWRAAGGDVTSTPAETADVGPYPVGEPLTSTVDAEALARQLGERPLIDARAPERYRGEVEPLDAQAGHIPGALNRFFKDNLDETARFKPAARLREEFDALVGRRSPGDVIHQCGSGVTACHNLLAMEHAGLEGSALYPGSWSEWSSDPRRPVARGN